MNSPEHIAAARRIAQEGTQLYDNTIRKYSDYRLVREKIC